MHAEASTPYSIAGPSVHAADSAPNDMLFPGRNWDGDEHTGTRPVAQVLLGGPLQHESAAVWNTPPQVNSLSGNRVPQSDGCPKRSWNRKVCSIIAHVVFGSKTVLFGRKVPGLLHMEPWVGLGAAPHCAVPVTLTPPKTL